MTAGKQLKEFNKHFGAVNCLEFHPKEFLLASGSSDRYAYINITKKGKSIVLVFTMEMVVPIIEIHVIVI